MRPLKLTIEGIKSFTESQTVDFTLLGKSNIFVISGVTGAGKSTVLDSIILALYGNKSDGLKLEEYINLKSERGKIDLEFEIEIRGEKKVYRVSRTFFRGKPSKAILLDTASEVVLAEGMDRVNAEIESLVGLGVDNFTKVIVLEQGKYGEFLKATRKKRTELVGSLFRLEKYRDLYARANAAKKELDGKLSALEEWLSPRKDLTSKSVEADRKEIKRIERRVAEITKELSALEQKQAALAALRLGYQNYQKAVVARKAAEKIFAEKTAALDVFEKKCGDIEADNERLNGLVAALAEVTAQKNNIECAKADDDKLKETKKNLLDKRREYAEQKKISDEIAGKKNIAMESAEKIGAKIAELQKRAAVLGWSVEDPITEAKVAETIGRLGLSNAAAAIAVGLSVGDDCPVCGGKVRERKAERGREFEAVEKILNELKEAAAALSERDKRIKELSAEEEKAKIKLDGILKEGEALKTACDGLESSLGKILCGTDYATAVRNVAEKQSDISRQKETLEKELKSRDSERKRLEAEKAAASGSVSSCVKSEADLKVDEPNEKEEKATLCAVNDLKKEKDGLLVESASLVLRADNGEKELAIKREKEAEKKSLSARADDLSKLAQLLKGDRFLEFVSEEYIGDFTVDASDTLAKMSGGCYTMGYEPNKGEFFVRDFRAGNAERNVRTLSGGETFLASLSLAIAVSRAIAAKNACGLKFDFLFLDEGFGTLHKDAIGVVERALRSLSKETLVGIVTHRSELSELIPDKLHIDGASPSSGSHVSILS